MLTEVIATRFDGRVGSGKTKPCRITCADPAGNDHELIVKFSSGCERGVKALIAESISAILAADLELPIPEPFVVDLAPDFVQIIPDLEIRDLAKKSVGKNFGSKKLPPGFSTWPVGKSVPQCLKQVAAEIFAFDALIQNPDRRGANPNCLINGNELAIYDHELAFTGELALDWRPPWESNSLIFLRSPAARHLFFTSLQGTPINYDRLIGAWSELTPERINQYGKALPSDWLSEREAISKILTYLNQLKINIIDAIDQVKGVLT